MKILITGVAGFIGYSLASKFLENKHTIFGIDNFDDYYSVKIKKKRISLLKRKKNFYFNKIDITNFRKIKNFFSKKKIDIIIHLAAQAGVRYSIINPNKYLDVNINGFLNLVRAIENKQIKKFIYASSSSVYGDSKKFPLKENNILRPKNIYGLSKKINEQIADHYDKIYKTKFIGLRFFTIYGEWGRPDMFMLKLFKSSIEDKIFYLNNFGKHLRDFTYIGDVINIIGKLLKKNIKKHDVYNICSNKPLNIYDIVKNFREENSLKLKLIKLNKADVLNTHGDNNKIKKFVNYKKFANFRESFKKTFKWYVLNKINRY